MNEMKSRDMLVHYQLTEDDIKTMQSFSQHTITEDIKSVAEAQHDKLKEEAKRIKFRHRLAEIFVHMLPGSAPYTLSQPFFEADYSRFINKAYFNSETSKHMLVICTHPLIVIYDNFLSEAECKWGIENFKHEKDHQRQGSFKLEDKETSQQHRISKLVQFKHASAFTTMMREKLMNAFFQNSSQMKQEFVQSSMIQHYDKGGFVALHADYKTESTHQRVFTTLAYLNTCEAGGETEFPYVGIRVKPVAGRLLLWQNAMCSHTCQGNQVPDPLSKHCGRVVGAGTEKYIVTTFLLDKPWLGPIGHKDEDVSRDGLPLPNEPESNPNSRKRKADDIVESDKLKQVKSG